MSRPRGRPKSETASASGTREGSRKLLKVLVAEQEDAAHCDDDNGDDADAVQLLFQETEETGDYKIKVAVDPPQRQPCQLVCAKCYGAWRNLDRRKKGDTVDYTDPSSTVRYSAIPRHDLEERSRNLAAVVK